MTFIELDCLLCSLSLFFFKELTVDGEFDFETNLAEFDKADISDERDDEDEDANDAYSKDNFFDTMSSEATDRINGIDNRLRGAAERSLNLDTFGAVSLGNNQHGRRRYYGGRDGGRDGGRGGRGWRGGRGRGRGRGGRGRDGGSGGGYQGNRGGVGDGAHNNNSNNRSGPVPRQNNRWKEMSSASAY